MEREPYFTWRQMIIIMLLALAGGCLYTWPPFKDFAGGTGVTQPASSQALLGGISFVFWISLSRQIIDKKYAELVTAIFIASIAWIINPWYGVLEYGIQTPLIFNLWRYASIIIMGIIIQLAGPKLSWRSVLGGGLGNLVSVGLTWLALGLDIDRWVFPFSEVAPFLIIGAIVSGSVGVLLAHGVARGIKIIRPGLKFR
jgi:hypothetical protein